MPEWNELQQTKPEIENSGQPQWRFNPPNALINWFVFNSIPEFTAPKHSSEIWIQNQSANGSNGMVDGMGIKVPSFNKHSLDSYLFHEITFNILL